MVRDHQCISRYQASTNKLRDKQRKERERNGRVEAGRRAEITLAFFVNSPGIHTEVRVNNSKTLFFSCTQLVYTTRSVKCLDVYAITTSRSLGSAESASLVSDGSGRGEFCICANTTPMPYPDASV